MLVLLGSWVPVASAASPRCVAPNVMRMSVQQARTLLLASHCLPGIKRDGRHFAINAACAPASQFGLITRQSKIGRLETRELLVLTKGIRQTADGHICETITPDTGTNATASDLNGRYDATFTVTSSYTPSMKVGTQLTGLEFSVGALKVTGDFEGTATWNSATGQASAPVRGNVIGVPCQGTLVFRVLADQSVTVASTTDVTCQAEGGVLKGTLKGRQID